MNRIIKTRSVSLLILACCAIATALSCGSSSPYYVAKPSEVRAQIKRLLYLPIYISPQFFPSENVGKANSVYTKDYAAAVTRAFKSKLPDLNHVAKAIIKSRDHFELIEASDQDLAVANPQLTRSEFFWHRNGKRDQEWLMNYEYTLTPEAVAKLLQKYNADGVLFQYAQVKKTWASDVINRDENYATGKITYTYEIVPHDSITLSPVLYNKSGQVVYGGIRYREMTANSIVENQNGDRFLNIEKSIREPGAATKIVPQPQEKVVQWIQTLEKQEILEKLNHNCRLVTNLQCGSLSEL